VGKKDQVDDNSGIQLIAECCSSGSGCGPVHDLLSDDMKQMLCYDLLTHSQK
jgi:hypothetical protein